jgi:hypothetical protein
MISEELGLIFVHIPKTAGTALSKTVFYPPPGDPHIGIPDLRVFHKDVEWDSYVKFCFLRDPFDRFASTYKQLVSKQREPKLRHKMKPEEFRDFVLNYWAPIVTGQKPKGEDTSMIEWLRINVVNKKYSAFSTKVYQDYLQESDGSLGVDYALDFSRPRIEIIETIDEKLKTLGKPITNSRGLRPENPIKWDNFWDHKTRQCFEEICKSDIEFYDELKKR